MYKSQARYIISYGGAGSGKSYTLAKRAIKGASDGQHWLIIRKTAVSIKDSVWALVLALLQEYEIPATVNKTDKHIKIGNGEIIFKGLDDPEKIKSIHGITHCWTEEATELEEEDFRQLTLRLRGADNIKRQFLLSFNPINVNHWLKRFFFDNPPDDAAIFKTTYLDNPYLDAEYKAELEALKDRDYYYYQVYCLGEFGEIDNSLIFSNYKIHDFEYESFVKNATIFSGLDFGFTHPSAFEQSFIRDGDLYIYNEYYERRKTNEDLRRKLVKYKGFHIVADSEDPGRITEFRHDGYKMTGADKPGGSVRMGLDVMKRFPCIHVHKTNCPNIGREFGIYKYRETKDGIIDDPVKLNDDGICAVRYSIESLWNRKRPEVNLSRRF